MSDVIVVFGVTVVCNCFLSLTGAVTRHVELEDDRVMHDPVYRSSRRHRIGEDLLPLREDQVRGDAEGAALITLGYQGEQHLGLLGTLRQVTKVVYHQQIEVVELPEHPRLDRGLASPPAYPAPGDTRG